MLKYLSGAALAVLFFVVLPLAISEGWKREMHRQEQIQQDRCAQYGSAINQWANERGYAEPCPPTPRG
jgi:hypothetical protein